MEQMERKLFEAAEEGNVTTLQELLQEDRLILDRVIVSCFNENPLHIAAMLGHLDFVNEVVRRKPNLAGELNTRRSSPLHLAAAKGYTEIVRALVGRNPHMCFIYDGDRRNPLHLAAIKGRVDVVRELLVIAPLAGRGLVDGHQTILHLCVKWNQLETLKLLVQYFVNDNEFLNAQDDVGFTILHLAVADKQMETVEYLLDNGSIIVNALNLNGFTALDILYQSQRGMRDMGLAEALRRAGGFLSAEIPLPAQAAAKRRRSELPTTAPSNFDRHRHQPPFFHMNNWPTNTKINQEDWLSKKRDTLMVVASLIATIAFQAGMNPPGGPWQDDSAPGSQPHTAGLRVKKKL